MPCIHRKSNRTSSRSFILLEVLIALVILTVGLVPLITPQLWLYREQIASVEELRLSIAASNHYVDLKERLYQSKVPAEQIPTVRSIRSIRQGEGYRMDLAEESISIEEGKEIRYFSWAEISKRCKGDQDQFCLLYVDIYFQRKDSFKAARKPYRYRVMVERKEAT